jgi:hypothetical protein
MRSPIGPASSLALVLALTCAAAAWAQAADQAPAAPKTRAAPPRAAVSGTHRSSPYIAASKSKKAEGYYQIVWGVDNLLVRQTASGNLLRFSYRVLDPERAKVLIDKQATPYMISQRTRAVLQVPVMDKVGQLRPTNPAKPGQEYWIVFSNKGNVVKTGDRVNVLIGNFRVDNLAVE